jgi:hypothetical protein
MGLIASNRILLVHTERGLRFFRVSDATELLDLRDAHPAKAIAVSPEGYRIATQVDHVIEFIDGRSSNRPAGQWRFQ